MGNTSALKVSRRQSPIPSLTQLHEQLERIEKRISLVLHDEPVTAPPAPSPARGIPQGQTAADPPPLEVLVGDLEMTAYNLRDAMEQLAARVITGHQVNAATQPPDSNLAGEPCFGPAKDAARRTLRHLSAAHAVLNALAEYLVPR